jgi:glycerol-3-phosphate acyltransferase PlsY
VAAVLLAGALGVAGWGMLPVLLAVVAGHIWPAQLHFRGGKGIATMVGALLFYDYLIPLILLGMVVLLFAVLRSITLAFVIALALLPLVLLAAGWPWPAIGSVVALAAIVLYAHRANIRARLQRRAGSPAS